MSYEERQAVFGSHGDFYIDKEGVPTGNVPKEYQNVKKVDLKEFDEWWKKCGFNDTVECIDILTIGYWYDEDGVEKYSPAEADYRKIAAEGWPQPIIVDEATAKVLGSPG